MSGRILGDYSIIKQIGQGSLGTVYLAEHRFMKRQYVLKVLPEELASDRGFIQRFEEEVGVLSTLDHPNLVKIHNVSHAQGLYFLVTDCIVDSMGETTNLAQYVAARGNRLHEDDVLAILRQIAEALDYAHSKSVGGVPMVHRNLKLNNILIGKKKQGTVEVSVCDFGLSKVIGVGSVLSRTYKALADALGIAPVVVNPKAGSDRYPSPPPEAAKLSLLHASFLQNYHFLAPEQKRLDDARPVDAKADVYAFGVLAYYLLMGEFPEGVFEWPSAKLPDLTRSWDSLLSHCLQSHPGKRPLILGEVLDRLSQAEKVALSPPVVKQSQAPVRPLVVTIEAMAPQMPSGTKPQPQVAAFVAKKEEIAPEMAAAVVLPKKEAYAPKDPLEAFRSELHVKHYQPEHYETKNIEPIQTEIVVIKGGKFYRGNANGSRDEIPHHQVTISNFAIDIHPVTNEQFLRFLEFMGGEKDNSHNDIVRLKDSRIKRSAGKLLIESGYAKHPVVGVTWYGTVAYVKWVGKRLPTEAEWEIASYGGLEGAIYPTGEQIEKSQANFFSSDTTPVMSYAPNGYGLFDMAGNVYEWCQDWYGYNYYETSALEPNQPHGPLQGVYRVLRGGCWKSLKEDLRCSHRHRNNPGTVNGTYGFRCAADVN